jgi:UDP:flavonoid glycosyltransferase YjiC (YdhE family)
LVDDEGMKALVTVMPLAGHVDPITGLVAELIARGHSVTVYTGSNYCERFAELGATPVRWSAATDFDERMSPPRFLRRGVRAAAEWSP